MADFEQEFLQQANYKKIDGSSLETMGKEAASAWADGRQPTLSDAVVSRVKHAGLSPEQVRRVIEFTNVEAYKQEFQKESSTHKIVDFGPAGPASPSVVFQDLNDGGGGTVFDSGDRDYSHPPEEKTSSASVAQEMKLASWFTPKGPELPEEDPFKQSVDLWVKLAGAAESLTSELSRLEVEHEDLLSRLYGQVKKASRGGHSLSEIATIWEHVAPDGVFVKTAFRALRPRLLDEQVFSPESLIQSFQKTASRRAFNPNHPLVQEFAAYCGVLEKLAETREQREEALEAHSQMTEFLTKAAVGGLVGKGFSATSKALDYAGRGGEATGRVLFGNELSPRTQKLLRRTGQVGAIGGAAAIGATAKREFDATPLGQQVARGTHAIKTMVPGTLENRQRQQTLMFRVAQNQALARGEYG